MTLLIITIITARKQGSVFSAVCGFFCFFVPQISPEPLNGSAPNSQGRRVWSLGRVWMSRSKVKGQGHQGPKKSEDCRVIPIQWVVRCKIWAADGTILWPPGVHGDGNFRWLACGACLVIPRLHDTTGCQTGLTTRCIV